MMRSRLSGFSCVGSLSSFIFRIHLQKGSPGVKTVQFRRFAVILLSFVMPASLATASTIIYSTDGTDTPAFSSGPGYGSYAEANSTAAMFLAGLSGILDDIVVAVSSVGNGTFQENLELRQDNGGIPGTVIDTISITIPNSAALVTGVSTSNPSLVAGHKYWLEDTIPPSALVGWYISSPAISGTVLASTSDNGPWESTCPACNGDLPAFALVSRASTVPEPATAGMCLGAVVAMIFVGSNRLWRRVCRMRR
jgi:hypothetical protein